MGSQSITIRGWTVRLHRLPPYLPHRLCFHSISPYGKWVAFHIFNFGLSIIAPTAYLR